MEERTRLKNITAAEFDVKDFDFFRASGTSSWWARRDSLTGGDTFQFQNHYSHNSRSLYAHNASVQYNYIC
jgi:hypothetical protein